DSCRNVNYQENGEISPVKRSWRRRIAQNGQIPTEVRIKGRWVSNQRPRGPMPKTVQAGCQPSTYFLAQNILVVNGPETGARPQFRSAGIWGNSRCFVRLEPPWRSRGCTGSRAGPPDHRLADVPRKNPPPRWRAR